MLHKRIERLRSELQARDVDCLALVPGANLYYLTGLSFHLMERPLVGFFPAEGMPAFALPALERAKFETLPYEAHFLTYTDSDTPTEAFEQAVTTLPEIHCIAVEHLRMRVVELKLVQRQVPTALLQNADPIMDTLRITKTDGEITAMRRAIEITEQALKAVVDDVRPGMTEREIVNRLTLALLERGGGGRSFRAYRPCWPKRCPSTWES